MVFLLRGGGDGDGDGNGDGDGGGACTERYVPYPGKPPLPSL